MIVPNDHAVSRPSLKFQVVIKIDINTIIIIFIIIIIVIDIIKYRQPHSSLLTRKPQFWGIFLSQIIVWAVFNKLSSEQISNKLLSEQIYNQVWIFLTQIIFSKGLQNHWEISPDVSRKAFAAKHSGLGRRALPRPCSGRSSPPRLNIKVMMVRSAIRVFLTSKRVFETLIPSGL